jgi:hypothetical protein
MACNTLCIPAISKGALRTSVFRDSVVPKGTLSTPVAVLACCRREVYQILNANGVETPPYAVCDRDGSGGVGEGRGGGRN